MEGDRAHNWSQARPSWDSRLAMFTPCLSLRQALGLRPTGLSPVPEHQFPEVELPCPEPLAPGVWWEVGKRRKTEEVL